MLQVDSSWTKQTTFQLAEVKCYRQVCATAKHKGGCLASKRIMHSGGRKTHPAISKGGDVLCVGDDLREDLFQSVVDGSKHLQQCKLP